jgi:predicted dienelactone hydrolase
MSFPGSLWCRARCPTLARLLAAMAVLAALGGPARAAPATEVSPLPLPGPYAVACSNVAQDFGRMAAGEDAQDYWEGVPRADGSPRYVTDLLVDPANTLAVTVRAPDDATLFGSFAGKSIPHVVLVCHPTAAGDPRPDYALPTGRSVPHMQRGAEPPLWPDATTRHPVLLFSHGYRGSPLSSDYVSAVAMFASFGYVVAAPFHGDPRFTGLGLESSGGLGGLATSLTDFVAMQALRPLSLSATLDLLLAHPHWRERVDPARIGGFGASMGGESLLLMAGAGLTKTLGQAWAPVTSDPRLRAAVGYVPYFGQPLLPSFGRDQQGLDGVTLPYLAISGTADTTAPIALTLQGMNRLAGTRELVALVGVPHGFDVASTADIFTWTLTFLDAEARGNAAAVGQLSQMASVAGGGEDVVVLAYNAPAPPNYGGLWWNAPPESESGWGINLAHQGDTIFATWFTYDAVGRAWWLSMTAERTADGAYAGTLYETRGPPFDAVPFEPREVTRTAVGSGTLTFAGPAAGTFRYTVGGVTQAKSIVPQRFGTLPTCVWGGQPDLARATNYQDLWWAAPAGSEAGWGVNLAHQGPTIFATWFTYDAGRNPLWYSVTAPQTAAATYTGTLYRTTGPAFGASPFDPGQVRRTAVGTATLAFADGNSGTLAYQVADGANTASQVKVITRQVFRAPGTVCR